LIKSGVDGKLMTVLRSMYQEVNLCVKHIGSVSDLFENNVGLFQG